MKLRLFYRDNDPGLEEHPIDRRVHERVGKRSVRRRLAQLSTSIVQALGPESKLWFDYEQTKGDLCARREEAYFDLGVEHGLAAARAEELEESRREVTHLAERLVREALSSGLGPEAAASAAVLAAWSLLGHPMIRAK